MSRVSPQLIVFSYHKSGTSLLLHVMTKVSALLGLTLENRFGMVDRFDPAPDIVLVPHSLVQAPPNYPYRAIRMVRDPRDIWTSGYLYHRHCEEGWCTNTDFDPSPPIAWPKVDYSFAHRPEQWKREYLGRLGGKSYQRNVRERSLVDGLDFEIEGYTGCTLATMREWPKCGTDALDVKLEDAMTDFDGTMLRVFRHFGFDAERSHAALDVARSEDIRRMDDANIAARPQIHSRTISKWRDVLSPSQIARVEAEYGDLIKDLGYAPSVGEQTAPRDASVLFAHAYDPPEVEADKVVLNWGEPVPPCDQHLVTPPGAGIWLSADMVPIHPSIIDASVYRFVVPAGTQRVRLESPRILPVDRRAPYLGPSHSLRIRVSEIAIRSAAGEVVIPADDPRLSHGWHEAAELNMRPWRWTDGSAEIPWAGVTGVAVVIVRCGAVPVTPAMAGEGLT